jgi:hypothetical protein
MTEANVVVAVVLLGMVLYALVSRPKRKTGANGADGSGNVDTNDSGSCGDGGGCD